MLLILLSLVVKEKKRFRNIVEYSSAVERQTKVALGLEADEDNDDKPKADNATIPIKKYNRNKVKYVCSKCDFKVWGKAGLHIICGDCGCEYEEEVENEEN